MMKALKRALGAFLAVVLLLAASGAVSVVKAEADRGIAERAELLEPDLHGECSHAADGFCSNLPLVIIDTGGQTIQKETRVFVQTRVVDNAAGKNHPGDEPAIDSLSTINYRGRSSYSMFDKKQYRLKFFEDETSDVDFPLMGMAPAGEWVLHGPFLDRSLVRNRLMYSAAREVMEWAPDSRYCEVFIDGEYQGIYLAVEPVTADEGRLNLFRYGMSGGQTSFIVRRELSVNVPISSYGVNRGLTDNVVGVEYPSEQNLMHRQKRWVEDTLNHFERVLYGKDFLDEKNGYKKYIDMQSFVDYYILSEFSMLSDAGHMSTYVYQNLGGKMKMAVWDFNNAFDMYQGSNKSMDEFLLLESNWFSRFLQDRAFVDSVVARYHELRRGVLSDDALFAIIDENVELLGDAAGRNFELWGYTFNENLLSRTKDTHAPRDPGSFEEAVTQLKACITGRGAFLDAHIEELYEKCIN